MRKLIDNTLAVIFLISVGLSIHFMLDVIMDFRTFKHIYNDCSKRGFIQNEKIRIKCEVE